MLLGVRGPDACYLPLSRCQEARMYCNMRMLQYMRGQYALCMHLQVCALRTAK